MEHSESWLGWTLRDLRGCVERYFAPVWFVCRQIKLAPAAVFFLAGAYGQRNATISDGLGMKSDLPHLPAQIGGVGMPEAIPSASQPERVGLRPVYSQRHRETIKRLLDISVALVALAVLLPVFAVVAALLWMEGGSSIIFRQQREGRNGVRFFCLKFRTMVPDAQRVLDELLASDPAARREWEADYKLRADPRVTKVGHFLRKTSIDELPQFVNVLKGDMSLVGPRPIVAAEIARYGEAIEYYYRCRPGLIGPWQVGGRNDITYGRRVLMDVDYAKNRTIRLDVVILSKALRGVLRPETNESTGRRFG